MDKVKFTVKDKCDNLASYKGLQSKHIGECCVSCCFSKSTVIKPAHTVCAILLGI